MDSNNNTGWLVVTSDAVLHGNPSLFGSEMCSLNFNGSGIFPTPPLTPESRLTVGLCEDANEWKLNDDMCQTSPVVLPLINDCMWSQTSAPVAQFTLESRLCSVNNSIDTFISPPVDCQLPEILGAFIESSSPTPASSIEVDTDVCSEDDIDISSAVNPVVEVKQFGPRDTFLKISAMTTNDSTPTVRLFSYCKGGGLHSASQWSAFAPEVNNSSKFSLLRKEEVKQSVQDSEMNECGSRSKCKFTKNKSSASSKSIGNGKKGRLLSTQLRQTHNAMERERRNDLKSSFADLGVYILGNKARRRRVSKLFILKQATQHIKYLQEKQLLLLQELKDKQLKRTQLMIKLKSFNE